MKVLHYSGDMKFTKISGLGRAISHQRKALENVGVSYTTNPNDDYDLVHINTYGPKSKALAVKAKREGKPVIYHAHSTEEDFRNSFVFSNLISRFFKKWVCSCYSKGDVILTPTEYSKGLLLNYSLGKPIYAISNGIDLNFFKAGKNDRKNFRSVFGFSETDKVIVSVGLFIERKGILDFTELARRMPEYKFIWFGETPLYSVPAKIRKAVKTNLPNLKFAGYVHPEVLRTAYVGADLYFFPTFEETEGIVLLEALACKAKVLLRDIPVFDWLEENTDCYKARGMEEMEEKIRALAEDKLPDLTENGYKKVYEKSIDKISLQLAEIYKNVNQTVHYTNSTMKPN